MLIRICFFVFECHLALSLGSSLPFPRPLQRKLESLVKCNAYDAQGPSVAMRSALSVAERAVSDLTVHLQAQQHEKISLWTAIRSHGCQFLGPGCHIMCGSIWDFYSPFLKLSDAFTICLDSIVISWLYLSGHLFYIEHFQELSDISPLYLSILLM